MFSMLAESIENLWLEVERLSRPVASLRVPGVGAEQVENAFGAPIPSDVVEWFGWCNGVSYRPGQVQDDAALIPGYEPLSVRDAAGVKASYGDGDPVLGDRWIPLLGTGGGDFYAAVYEPSSPSSRVASVMIGGESRMAYESVEQMVNAFRNFFRTGVFFIADDGTLDADDDLWISSETGSGPEIA
ncbi:hypothetical protein SLUN_16005 [Streptomyces lunaelactis]|uniref:Knr4/Smi1-like domain-containing protein n=2 Tax=Streptomyces lunaelactis TaxID=1535768 RepID=A0A2R4T2V3_9ACTN|nr:SMI1/KNR4 family protein [Streptomyces lunaelactis]AVZ73458.1 hypothetical protein SLUN_16005 [Streptomyces lunaelactis]NUK84825.1 SMI1/KNR4 family protein [Streptomyces lunaelactis]